MATTADTFYPHTTNWDGTDPASGDVVKLLETLPALVTTSSCEFGTSGAKTITVDPYTSGRTTTGLDSGFGWAIDIDGSSDAMDSTATAKRWIKTGAWVFQGTLLSTTTLGVPAASAAACTVGMNVYRVAASPSTTRTLLFSDSVNAGIVSGTGTGWSRTTASQSEIVLEAGETIQVTYTLACTGQLGGLIIQFRTGDQLTTDDTLFTVPSPGIRTLGEGVGAASGVGTVDGVGGKILATVGSSTGTSTVTGVLGATGSMTGTAAGSSTVTGVLGATGSMEGTAAGTGTAAGVGGKILGTVGTVTIGAASGDYSGSDPTFSLTGTILTTAGAPIEGATVKLFRQSDDLMVASTTSAADGSYSFTRDSQDPYSYYVLSYEPIANPQTHGTSDRDLVPS